MFIFYVSVIAFENECGAYRGTIGFTTGPKNKLILSIVVPNTLKTDHTVYIISNINTAKNYDNRGDWTLHIYGLNKHSNLRPHELCKFRTQFYHHVFVFATIIQQLTRLFTIIKQLNWGDDAEFVAQRRHNTIYAYEHIYIYIYIITKRK